jgi:hypothetical protein
MLPYFLIHLILIFYNIPIPPFILGSKKKAIKANTAHWIFSTESYMTNHLT